MRSTPGIVTVTVNGVVQWKIIADHNGQQAAWIADHLRDEGLPESLEDMIALIEGTAFAAGGTLMAMDSQRILRRMEGSDEVEVIDNDHLDEKGLRHYRGTFHLVGFNPGWDWGDPVFNEVVNIERFTLWFLRGDEWVKDTQAEATTAVQAMERSHELWRADGFVTDVLPDGQRPD